MEPYYEQDGISIYNCDCRDVAADLDFGAIVTDPPYGTGHDAIAGDDEYPEEVICWGGTAIAFGAGKRFVEDTRSFTTPPDRVLIWAPTFAWSKGSSGGVMFKWSPIYCWQTAKVPQKDPPYGDVFTHAITGEESRRTSSVTKPVPLMRDLIRMTEGVVLDPFCGGGSTLAAARDLDREAIGIEIDEAHCERAANRLAQGVFDFS